MNNGSTAVGMSLFLARGRPNNPVRDTSRPKRRKSQRLGRLVLQRAGSKPCRAEYGALWPVERTCRRSQSRTLRYQQAKD
jgi:hypothetical protein